MFTENPFAFPGKNILLVEDNLETQDLMANMIHHIKCNCDFASNGQEAIDKYKQNKYDVILMDIQMPIMNGYDVTIEIRKLEAGKCHTPILALTASALSHDYEKCFQVGMDDYLSKPITIDKLESKLHEIFLNQLEK